MATSKCDIFDRPVTRLENPVLLDLTVREWNALYKKVENYTKEAKKKIGSFLNRKMKNGPGPTNFGSKMNRIIFGSFFG